MSLGFVPFKNQTAEVVMHSMERCPHCIAARPNFLEARKRSNMEMRIVDSLSEEGKVARGFGVRSYPTILGRDKTGKVHEYFGDRTMESFLEFSQFLSTTRT